MYSSLSPTGVAGRCIAASESAAGALVSGATHLAQGAVHTAASVAHTLATGEASSPTIDDDGFWHGHNAAQAGPASPGGLGSVPGAVGHGLQSAEKVLASAGAGAGQVAKAVGHAVVEAGHTLAPAADKGTLLVSFL
jgi:hypothetical protein